MSRITLLSEQEIADFVTIAFHAYPKVFAPGEENKDKTIKRFIEIQKNYPSQNFYGLYRDGQMLGGMQLHNFMMKLHFVKIPVGGVGSVGVDFLHKKEGVCKELITYFLNHYRDQGYNLVALYPFRPDFYKKMGFGFGPKMNRYKTKPVFFPRGKENKQVLHYLTREDSRGMVGCHNRVVENTHGMIEKDAVMIEKIFDNPENRVVGYKEEEELRAYIVYRFVSHDEKKFLLYDMYIEEIIYEDRETLQILLAFLRSQEDQVQEIIIDTHDEYFHYLLEDVRNGSNNFLATLSHESNLQGLGIMYRVVNVRGIFESLSDHNFGGQNCKLKLSIKDDFFPCNNTNIIIHFIHGIAEVKAIEDYEVEVVLGISEFSSLLMGTVSFNTLHRYGLASISDGGYNSLVQRIFMTDEKPRCTVRF
jgi:predicted acetyltransferase